MKTCRKCGVFKSLSDFHRATGMRDGHRSECKDCWRDLQHAAYMRNREKRIKAAQEWKQNNPEKYAAQKRRYQQDPQRRARPGTVGRICGRSEASGLHIDHVHGSGFIRGLLCGKCNKAIGLFDERPDLFALAAAYLQRDQLALGCGDWEPGPTRVGRRTERPPVTEEM